MLNSLSFLSPLCDGNGDVEHVSLYPVSNLCSNFGRCKDSKIPDGNKSIEVKTTKKSIFDAQQRFSINMQTCERNFSGLPKWPDSEFANSANTRHIEKVLLLHIELVRPFCSCHTYRRYCSWFIWLNSPVAIQRHYAYKPLRIINNCHWSQGKRGANLLKTINNDSEIYEQLRLFPRFNEEPIAISAKSETIL